MKKRIISMLLAVCMVVACTLAITPAVYAESDVTVEILSVSGDIGDIVTVPLIAHTADGEDFGWSGYTLDISKIDGVELVGAITGDGTEMEITDFKEYTDHWRQADANTSGENWVVADGEAWFTLMFEIKSFVNVQAPVTVVQLVKFDESGAKADITFDVTPGTISVDGSIESLPEFTASNVKVTSADDDARAADQDEADAYNDGAYNSKNTKIVDRTITLTNNFEGDVAYISAESWESIESSINSKYGKHSTRAGKCTVVDSTAAIGTAKNTITIISAKKDKFTVPATIYIDANVDLSLSNVGQQFLKKAENVYFVGDFNAASLEAITSAAADDEDCCALDYLCDSDATVYAWNGSKVFNFFSGTVAATYCTDIYEDDPVEVKAIDSFVPVGYQGPAEVTNKKFRVDSAIKYADTQFVVDEQPKNIYDTASCYITVIGKVNGVDVDKKLTKEIGTVYKSLSGVNGVAVPACDGYYFSALAISDLPELQEGEELVFTFTNTVTNIFGGETTSEPVSLTYHADGSITQE